MTRNRLQYLQILLYLLVGRSYYKKHTRKETSPEFYKSRTCDLAGLDMYVLHFYILLRLNDFYRDGIGGLK